MIHIYPSLKNFLLIPFLLFHALSFGQSATLSGKIADENNEPLIGAVAELHSTDSSLAKINVTDVKGLFAFANLKAGKYFLKSSLLGFTPYSSEVFSYDGAQQKNYRRSK